MGGTKALARPKSAILRRPSLETKMLCGLRSLRQDQVEVKVNGRVGLGCLPVNDSVHVAVVQAAQ
jgi:hypothetical protein